MGLLDKIKGAINAVTGGAAKVSLEFEPAVVVPGDEIAVRVTVSSTGGDVKSGGLFIDIIGVEQITARGITPANAPAGNTTQPIDVNLSKTTYESSFQISPPFELVPMETRVFEGIVRMPTGLQASFDGFWASHRWNIRARVEAFGNDPDSGFQPLRVGVP